jgi:serine/threonine-protein kinase ATR
MDPHGVDLKALALHGHKLSEALLDICDADTSGLGPNISLSKNLGFSHRLAPCNLVVPLERTLTAILPAVVDKMAAHKAFSSDVITISCK